MRLVLFDFDGTLTTRDSLAEFIKFYKGSIRFYAGLTRLSPWLLLFKIGLVPNWRAKEILLTYFIGGADVALLSKICDDFVRERIPACWRADVMNRLKDHQAQGDAIYVVSASPELWVKPMCSQLNVGSIATRLEIVNGKFTGKIAGRNCYGIEKVNRIRQEIDLRVYSGIVAYGNSRGDKEMMALADQPNYV